MSTVTAGADVRQQENAKICYTAEELMDMMDLCRNSLMKLIRRNEFPYLKIAGRYFVPKESFDRWLDA